MKRFIYCEAEEGGMDHFIFSDKEELRRLYGWMDDSCLKNDKALIEWCDTAEIGDYSEHRLGIAVRLSDYPF